jgi:hypothetical protein
MEAKNGTQPTEVSRVEVRLPPFSVEGPALWFAQAEAQFSLAGISNELTKFYYVVSQLDCQYAAEVKDIIISPPQQDPYTKLKTELLRRLSPSTEQRASQSTDTTEVLRRFEEFSRQLTPLIAEINCSGTSSSSRDRRSSHTNRHPDNRSLLPDDTETSLCWYHRRFGTSARKCTHPCAYHQQRKVGQQISTTANVYTTTARRLFVTDRSSKQQFLINTGSDLCMFPRKLITQRKESVNYDIRAANGTTVPTYGWLSLSLNLGLSHDFLWRFVVADVMHPLIGADFLSHFGLLVDCRNNRLLEKATSLSAPLQAAGSLVPSVKVNSGGTSVDPRPNVSSASLHAAPPTRSPPKTSSVKVPRFPSYNGPHLH